jgi:hypothetical protein
MASQPAPVPGASAAEKALTAWLTARELRAGLDDGTFARAAGLDASEWCTLKAGDADYSRDQLFSIAAHLPDSLEHVADVASALPRWSTYDTYLLFGAARFEPRAA